MRPRMAMAAIAAVLVLSGCTPGDDASTGDEPAVEQSPTETAMPDARWTKLETPSAAKLSGARVEFRAVLAGTGQLPHTVVGVAAKPGKPDRVRIWTSEDTSAWEAADVPLGDGAHAAVAAGVSDGSTTVLVGSTWTAEDGTRPYALTSDDRLTWEEVALPEQAHERAVDVQAVHLGADGALVLVGVDRDGQPVAVRAGDGGEVVDLPLPEGGTEIVELVGVAGDGDALVALAQADTAGRSSPITYVSGDGGATWELADGPTSEPATVDGLVRAGGSFVATGSIDASTGDVAAAWSSADGSAWTAEEVPAIGRGPGDGFGRWLGIPAADGDEVVAAYIDGRERYSTVMARDASGSWSTRGRSDPWITPEVDSIVAPLEDGSVLMAHSGRNSGIIGVVSVDEKLRDALEAELGVEGNPAAAEELEAAASAGAKWTTSLDTIGPNDEGIRWNQVTVDGETPVLLGSNEIITVRDNDGWERDQRLIRLALSDDATLAKGKWDPPKSKSLATVAIATDDAGATAVIGTESLLGTGRDDYTDAVGWFRPSPDGKWKRAKGLDSPHSEYINDVAWLGDQWVAVGVENPNSAGSAEGEAAVWTSPDGGTWTREEGPFESSSGPRSGAAAACALPGGTGALVVGWANTDTGMEPAVWRQGDDGWTRVDQAALGDGDGELISCAVQGDTSVVQGTHQGRAALWRTSDGEAFEKVEVGHRGDFMERVVALERGFVAGGTRTVGGDRGAVVWLSGDGQSWEPIPVPSNRLLQGADVLEWNGRLIFATRSDSGPDIWVLENLDELLSHAARGT